MTKLPKPSIVNEDVKKTLPYNGNAVSEKSFVFSFVCFDRTHELFNLGDTGCQEGVICGNWFIELLDCFKSVGNFSIYDLKVSIHDLHPINWDKTNASCPTNSEQLEYKQFRINKSKGRIIGFSIDNVFYIVWLDPHHNLTDSEGYGGKRYYTPGKSLYEKNSGMIQSLESEIQRLNEELKAAEELLDEISLKDSISDSVS